MRVKEMRNEMKVSNALEFVSVAEVDAVLKRSQSRQPRRPDGGIRLHQVGTLLLLGSAPPAADAAQTLVRSRDV